ncbi:MAG: hypothetical protein QW609_04240 [Candidatus Aenigmatarchaeota archaeon]
MYKKVDRDIVRKLFRKGLSDYEIAKELRCKPMTVACIRREMGLYRRDVNLKKKVLRLWEEGYRRPSAIAYRLKKHPVVISNILVKLGLRKKIKMKEAYHKMFEMLLKKPMFEDELKNSGIKNPRSCYKTLVLKGYNVECFERKNMRIYFTQDKRNEAISRLNSRLLTI